MKKVYFLPNCITAFGLTCGLFVIFKNSMLGIGESQYEHLKFSAIILLLAALADLMDGAVARAMKAESEFGEAFDSLADAISFGVAPSVITLKALSVEPKTGLNFFLILSAMIFSVCGVLRLVRFSVDAQHVRDDATLLLAHKKNFTGLPIPAAAAAIVSLNLFFFSPEMEWLGEVSQFTRAVTLSCALVLLGYFMVSYWKFPSLKALQVRVASFQLVFATAMITSLGFYGLIYHFSVVFLIGAWLYVAAACVLSVIRLLAGRKSQTLKDFEPECEEGEEV